MGAGRPKDLKPTGGKNPTFLEPKFCHYPNASRIVM